MQQGSKITQGICPDGIQVLLSDILGIALTGKMSMPKERHFLGQDCSGIDHGLHPFSPETVYLTGCGIRHLYLIACRKGRLIPDR